MVHEPVLRGLTGREGAVVIRVGSQSVDSLAAVHSEHVLVLGAGADHFVGLQDELGKGPLSLGCGLVEHDPSARQCGPLPFGSRGEQDGSDTECLPHTGGCDGGADRRWRS